MNYTEYIKIIGYAKAYYPDAKTLPTDKLALETWYSQLKEFDFNLIKNGLDDYARINKFSPRLCDLIDFSLAAIEPEYLEPEQAWSIVFKAASNSGYHSTEEFAKLPKEIQQAVGSPWNLQQMALTSIDTLNRTVKIDFLKAYQTILKRASELTKKTSLTQLNIRSLTDNSAKGDFENLIGQLCIALQSPEMPHKPFLELRQGNIPEEEKKPPKAAITALESYVFDCYNDEYDKVVSKLISQHEERMLQKVLRMGE